MIAVLPLELNALLFLPPLKVVWLELHLMRSDRYPNEMLHQAVHHLFTPLDCSKMVLTYFWSSPNLQ